MAIVVSLLAVAAGLGGPVLLVVLLAAGLARARAEDPEPPDPGIGTVRRLFLYALAFVSLILAATGVALLLAGMLDGLFGELLIAESDTELATALSLTVVGLPAWLIFALIAQRSVQRQPVEAYSIARWMYLSGARAVFLAVAVFFAVEVGTFLLGVDDFEGVPWAWFVVGLAVWGGHQAAAAGQPAPSGATRYIDRLYLGFGAVLGLYVLGFGLGRLMVEPGLQAYDALFREALVRDSAWTEGLRQAGVQAVVGAVAWWWHWHARLRSEARTIAWRIVVFIFGVLAGLTLAVVSAAGLLFLVLEWLIDYVPTTATAHFVDAVPAIAGLVLGLGAWVYHRTVLAERAAVEARRGDVERSYEYLVAAAGLLTLAGGLTWVFAVAVDGLLPVEFVRDSNWWRGDLAMMLTLLAVGAPLWARYWFATQRVAEAETPEGADERDSLARRVFIFVIFGVAVLVVLVNLAILLFQVFDAVLEGTFSAETIRDVRWSLALLFTAGATSGYYWLVLRDDQARDAPVPSAGPGAATPAPMVLREAVVIAPAATGSAIADALRERGVRVRRYDRTDIAGVPAQDLSALLERIALVEAASAVLLVEASGEARILPAVPG